MPRRFLLQICCHKTDLASADAETSTYDNEANHHRHLGSCSMTTVVQLPAAGIADPAAQATYLRRQYLYVRQQFSQVGDFTEQLAAKIPVPLVDYLITGEHLAESLSDAAGPYLWLRLVLEHPQWWLSPHQRDTRAGVAWILARYGTCSAPDHRGELIGATGSALSTLSMAAEARQAHWIARAGAALKALAPDAAAAIADALTRELWGRWIVNDLALQVDSRGVPAGVSIRLVLNGTGTYCGEPAFDEYMLWPINESRRDVLEESGLAAHVAINAAIEQIGAELGLDWAEDLRVFTAQLDLVSLTAIAPILGRIPLAGSIKPRPCGPKVPEI